MARQGRSRLIIVDVDVDVDVSLTLQIVNLMLLDNNSRAQISWYSYASTTLLPLNSLKPFLQTFEVNTDIFSFKLILILCFNLGTSQP